MGRICQAQKKKGGKVDDDIKMDGWGQQELGDSLSQMPVCTIKNVR